VTIRCGLLTALLTLSAAAPLAAQVVVTGPTLVLPFEGGNDPRAAWLGEAVAMLLADDLNALGGNALTREERVRAFERLQLSSRAKLTSATTIKIGQLVGASTVVSGQLEFSGDSLGLDVEAVRIDTGRVSATFQVRGPLADVLATIERAARRLSPGATVPTAEVEHQHPPLAAYEYFVKGLLSETPSTARSYLEKAIALAPDFDRARLALADVHADGGDWEGARTVALAVADASPLRRQAVFAAALAEINLKRYDDAFGRLQALASQAPSPEVFNNLGVIQLRRPPTPQTGRATYYFNKAVELEPSADATFNLGYAYWREQDNAAALYWLRESVRRDPADADAHFVLAASLDSTGAATEAGGERELARRLSAAYEEGEDRTSPGTSVPPSLERVSTFLRRPESGRTDSVLVATEQREQREMATFHLDRGRRFYEREDDRNALTELQRAIYLSPYQAEAHLLVGRIHLRAGRTREAIEALKISLWSEETAAAHQALAEAYVQAKDTASARKEAERALALSPGLSDATKLLQQLGSQPPKAP
jgi:tetratricopeptide (TPR) repeat protein